MKNILSIGLAVLSFALSGPIEARGGRGGGGGRGGSPGGGFRPSRPSAPATQPARPQRPAPGPRPGTRPVNPGVNPGNAPIARPSNPRGPGAVNPRPGTLPSRPGGRPGAGDIGRHLGGNAPGSLPARPGFRPGYPGVHKAELRNTVIPKHFPYHPIYGYPFGQPWLNHLRWHYNNWPVWTIAATGVAIANWIGYGSYDGYGSSEAVTYYPEEAPPAEVYDESVTAPEQMVAEGQAVAVPDDSEWLNLGTFGLIPPRETDMTFTVQLALTKDGLVRGLQLDLKANTTAEVEGSIDQETLKIAWRAKGDANAPYFETNVDQLTQEESLVNVYSPITKSLISWQTVRVDEEDLPPKS